MHMLDTKQLASGLCYKKNTAISLGWLILIIDVYKQCRLSLTRNNRIKYEEIRKDEMHRKTP